MGMKKKTRDIPSLSLKPSIKPSVKVDQNSNSPKMVSPHFTVRVTEFQHNVPKNTVLLDRNTMSKNITQSIERIVPCTQSRSDLDAKEFSPARKKIKMSEETPSKRVILVVPNESTSKSERGNSDEKQFTTHNHHKSIIKNTVTEIELNQSMTDSSEKSIVDDRLAQESEFALMNSITEINTDEGFHETLPCNKLKNSSININHNTSGQYNVTTSTPKLHRNFSQRTQIMRINELPQSKFRESINPPFNERLMRTTLKSANLSKTQQQSVKTLQAIPLIKNDLVPPIESLSSDNVNTIITRNSASESSSLRQIKINGLTLKAIDPTILNDTGFKERMKGLNLSCLNGIASKTEKSLEERGTPESIVTTTIAAPSQKIAEGNLDCKKCGELQSEVDKQWQTILNLKSRLINSIPPTRGKPFSNSHSANEELKLTILKQMNDINKQLLENLKRESVRNKKLRTGMENRDKHIEELECELANVLKLFTEIETKSVSLKKLIPNGNQRFG